MEMSFSPEEIADLQKIGRLTELGPGGAGVVTPAGINVFLSYQSWSGWAALSAAEDLGPRKGSPLAAYIAWIEQRAERSAKRAAELAAELQAERDRVGGGA